jgi:anti-sigma regulatory factor (Ser/Thr protein kinase)
MTPMAPTRPIRPIRPPDPTNTAALPGPSAAANGGSVRISRAVRLAPRLSAVASARAEVEAAICAWGVPVDPDVAILLTSELVTNAITHAAAGASRNRKAARRGFAAEAVLLVIAADDAGLRVDVHDGCGDLPVLADCPADADAETGRGLLLVTSLSAEWGFYRTPGGKAVYFTLQAQPDVHGNVIGAPHGHDPRSVT